jgi:DNA-binding MarR family transcriptional regulator
MARTETASATSSAADQAVTRDLELELLLLGRHTAIVANDVATGPRLDRSAYLLLTRLELSGAMTLKELADALRLDASTVSRQTAAIVKAGLAERIPGTVEQIARRYRPTARGLAELHADRTERLAQLGDLLVDWDPRDRRRLVGALRMFNEQIEHAQDMRWPRDRKSPAPVEG